VAGVVHHHDVFNGIKELLDINNVTNCGINRQTPV